MKTSASALVFGCLTALVFSANANETDNDNVISNSVSLGLVFRFTANVANIDQNCIESSDIILSDLYWKVKLCKKEITNSNHVLVVLLESSADNNILNYACEAQASIKLLPKAGQSSQAIVHKMAKHKHTNTNPAFAIKRFTSWDIFQNYLNQNEAIFEIEISTIRLNDEESTDVEIIQERINVRLENVSKFTQIYSPVVIARGIQWRANILKNDDFLSVYLEANEKQFNMGYFYNVEVTLKLLPNNNNLKPLNYSFKHDYRYGSSLSGVERFVGWYDLNKNFVQKDKAALLIQFQVGKPQSLWDIDGNDLSLM